MGTQQNRLNKTVLLSTQNICKNLWVRKYLQKIMLKIFVNLNLCDSSSTSILGKCKKGSLAENCAYVQAHFF